MDVVHRRFNLLRRLGEGGEGECWLAEERATGEPVVCKRLLLVSGEEADGRGAAGAQAPMPMLAGMAVRMPGRARAQRFHGAEGSWSVTPYVTGLSLHQLRQALGLALGDAVVLELLWRLAIQLVELHRDGVMHGDIAPGNVIIRPSGALELIDFGQSARFGQAASHWGAKEFLAPERIEGGMARPESDIYSLGCLLYWLLEHPLPEVLTARGLPVEVIQPDDRHSAAATRAELLTIARGLTELHPSSRPTLGRVLQDLKELRLGIPAGVTDNLVALVQAGLSHESGATESSGTESSSVESSGAESSAGSHRGVVLENQIAASLSKQ